MNKIFEEEKYLKRKTVGFYSILFFVRLSVSLRRLVFGILKQIAYILQSFLEEETVNNLKLRDKC